MSAPLCRIDRLRFEIEAGSVAAGRALQQRLSAFSHGPLQQALEPVLAAAGRADSVCRFERIELDLGLFEESQLERQLGERLAGALASFLRGQGVLRPGALAASAAPAAEADAQLARVFAGGVGAEAAALLSLALQRRPDQVLRLLRSEGRKQAVRQRLALHLPQALIVQLIGLLEPGEAPQIVAYVAEVCQLHRQRPLVAESRRHFRAVLWEFVLAYLLLERGSYFNTRTLVAHTLQQMARRYRVDYAELLAQLSSCLHQQQLAHAHGQGLAAILLDLRERHGGQEPATAHAEHALLSEQVAALAGFFARGVLPATAAGGLAALLDSVLESSPGHLQALLRRIGRQQPVRQRLASQLSEAQVLQVLDVLEPGQGGWIAGSVQTIARVQQRQRVVQDDALRFRHQLWEFVFCALLVERGSWFNTRAFVMSLLLQMAARYRIAYRVLLQELIGPGLAPAAATRRQHGLTAILLSLQQACRADEPAPARAALNPLQAGRAAAALVLRHTLAGTRRGAVRAALLHTAQQLGCDPRNVMAALLAPQGALLPLLQQRDTVYGILAVLGAELPQAEAAPAEPAPPRFARAAREFTIRSFRLGRGSYFNNRSYIKDLLEQLSARHAIAYDQLLRGLIAQAGATAGLALPQTTLPAILLSLKREAAPSAGRSPPFPAPMDETDLALYFLEYGCVPHGAPHGAALRELGLWQHDGAALAQVLRHSAQRSGALERLLRYGAPQVRAAVLRALSPEFAGFAETCVLAFLTPVAGAPWPHVRGKLSDLAWRVVLRAVLAADGKAGPDALIGAFCGALAARLGLTPAVFRARWLARARALPDARFEVLASLLAPHAPPLAVPPVPPRATRPAPSVPVAAEPADLAALLSDLLRYGLHAALARTPGHTAAGLMAQIGQAMRREPARFRALLLRAAGRQLERHRIAHLLAPALRRQVLAVLLGAQAERCAWWQGALARSLGAQAGAPRGAALDAALAEQLLRSVQRLGPDRFTLARYLPELFAHLQQRYRIAPGQLVPALRAEAAGTRAAAEARALLDTLARQAAQLATPAQAQAPATEPAELALQEHFAVDNAGLVLLWPFLDRYFSLLGMVQGGAFVSQAHRCRAVHLLHYLSHGTVQAPEHALLLNKLLCGIPGAEPLEVGGPLSEQERTLSEQILGAVTQNWSKLKNTDADGLRATFLRRSGYLTQMESHWELAVERSAFDVLMSSLPWALGTVKLSWMEQIVKVSW